MPTPQRSPERPAGSPSVDEIADELYGLPPEEFTAARNRQEKQARAAGHREVAAGIHRLKKPTVTAWLANQLVREHPDELRPLVDLGAQMREATRELAGDQLRRLSRQRHRLVYAVVQQARQLARAAGRPVSDATARGLEDTLHAALADERAAAQLLAGRLTEGLQRIGFDAAAGDDSPPVPPREEAGRRTSRESEQRSRAEQDLADAERALRDATQARDQAQVQAAEAEQAARAAREKVDELQRRLDEAGDAAADADRHRRDQTAKARRAQRAVDDAERRRAAARARRDRLAKGG